MQSVRAQKTERRVPPNADHQTTRPTTHVSPAQVAVTPASRRVRTLAVHNVTRAEMSHAEPARRTAVPVQPAERVRQTAARVQRVRPAIRSAELATTRATPIAEPAT